jgi:HAMP domain-containing protein
MKRSPPHAGTSTNRSLIRSTFDDNIALARPVAAVTLGLVRPVRRLLAGTSAVEGGALDNVIPIASRDEVGRVTHSFNNMVSDLGIKAHCRRTDRPAQFRGLSLLHAIRRAR